MAARSVQALADQQRVARLIQARIDHQPQERTVAILQRDARYALLVGLYICAGQLYYTSNEDWSALEALYFIVATMSTVGYGDLTPTSDGCRAFTAAYILVGVLLIFTLAGRILEDAFLALEACLLYTSPSPRDS